MKTFIAAREAPENDVDEPTHLNFQRAYRLTPIRKQADDPIAQVRIGATVSQNVLLPYAIGLGYFIVPAINRVFNARARAPLAQGWIPHVAWARSRSARRPRTCISWKALSRCISGGQILCIDTEFG